MAEPNKMFAGAAKLGKKVPKWAYYVSGGVLVAGGVMYFRNKQDVSSPEPGSDMAGDQGAVGYTDPVTVTPGLVVPQVTGDAAVPAEINTDIPSSTLGVFSDLFGTLGGVVTDQSDLIGILAGAGGGGQQGAAPAGVVTAAPTGAAKPKPKPNPVARLGNGFRAGATVNMGANAQKTFNGAIGWMRIADGGKGADHWIDVHVRYCNKLERWRVRPNKKGSPWQKLWSGPRPDICK